MYACRFNSVNWFFRHWIFLGFTGSPRDFFGSRLLAPFDHPRHLKSRVLPLGPPPSPLGGILVFRGLVTLSVTSSRPRPGVLQILKGTRGRNIRKVMGAGP